jgi:hypothetical protein
MKISSRGFPWSIVILFVILKLSFHFLTNTNYELHRDAYLYLAQGDHPAWGYLSVPPFTAFLSKIFRMLFGESVFALRLLPAVFGGLTVFYISLMVREFGGRSWALVLANLGYLFSVSYLRTNTLLQPVALDIFFWTAAYYYILRLIKSGNARYWFYLAVIFGMGFLNKYSMAFLGMGFIVSLMLTPERERVRHRYFLISLALGFFLVLPNLVWQYNHHWPVIYHFEMLNKYQLVHVRLFDFLTAQLLMNINAIIIWVAGLLYLLFNRNLRNYRVLGYSFLAVMMILILGHGKHYYTLGLYPMLFAAGGYVLERWSQNKYWLVGNAAFIILISIPLVPIGLPLLKYNHMLSYCRTLTELGLDMPMRWEDGRVHPLPQDYADMIGWQELAEKVIQAYQDLPEMERKSCYIYAENYGQAGAIHFYGRKAGIPEVISFNGSFVFWAPEEIGPIKTLIYVNDEVEELLPLFENIRKAGEITNPYARETGLPVWICQGPFPAFYQLYRDRVEEERSRFMRKMN